MIHSGEKIDCVFGSEFKLGQLGWDEFLSV